MNSSENNTYSFDIFSLIKLILRWKWPLIAITVISGVATYIFTGPAFIAPQYLASAIFYPTSNAAVSTTLMTEPGVARYNLLEFGNDQDAEQLLQILKSEELKNAVIDKFNLAKHYEMDTTNGKSMYGLQMALSQNLKVKQTEYKAIEISVYDTDPQQAADMANFIANYADYLKTSIQKVKAKQALDIISNEYFQQKKVMDSIEITLLSLRKKGVYDYFEQSSQLNEAYANNQVKLEQENAMLKVYEDNPKSLPDTLIVKSKARAKGFEAALRVLKPKVEALAIYGGTYINNINNLEVERKKLGTYKIRYESTKLDFEQKLPQKFMIHTAVKPEIIATPRRMLSSGIAVLSAFVLSILIIVFIEAFPALKSKLD